LTNAAATSSMPGTPASFVWRMMSHSFVFNYCFCMSSLI
jgi:hypothetical protein